MELAQTQKSVAKVAEVEAEKAVLSLEPKRMHYERFMLRLLSLALMGILFVMWLGLVR